jgi:hypothetical protein
MTILPAGEGSSNIVVICETAEKETMMIIFEMKKVKE